MQNEAEQIELASNNSSAEVCKKITNLTAHFSSLVQNEVAKSAGQAVLGFHGVISFHGSYVVSSYLQDFCDPLQMFRKQIKFNDHKKLFVRDLYPDPTLIFAPIGSDFVYKISSYLLADLSDAVIVGPSLNDKQSLLTNLKELKRLLFISTSN